MEKEKTSWKDEIINLRSDVEKLKRFVKVLGAEIETLKNENTQQKQTLQNIKKDTQESVYNKDGYMTMGGGGQQTLAPSSGKHISVSEVMSQNRGVFK